MRSFALKGSRSLRLAGAVAVALLLAAGCGGGADSNGSGSEDTSEAAGVSATLEIITTNIETSVDEAPFEEATAGEELFVGDRVKTDDTGFAELSYHDGSWQRVENNATLTLEKLLESDKAASVATSVDVGRTWNRVRELSEPDDAYELETPVATAAVRGTAFSTECPDENECTFKVVYGTVAVTPLDSEPIELVAPATLTVRRNEPPPEPQTVPADALRADPWIKKNLELDGERFGEEGAGDEGAVGAEPTPEQLRTASVVGTYDVVTTVVSSNVPESLPGSSTNSTVTIEQECKESGCVIYRVVDGSSTNADLVFDGTYSERQEVLEDCFSDDTGEVLTEDAARFVWVTQLNPGAAEFVDGQWVLMTLNGNVSLSAEMINPEAGDCRWKTTDGAPSHAESTITMTRRP
jgi:hypothetical protein